MKTRRLLAIALTSLAATTVAGPAQAQAGDKRLSAQFFGLASKYSNTKVTGTVYGQVGYLFTDRIEGGVSLAQTLGAAKTTGIGLFGKYYFGGVAQAKSWLPYAHAAVFRNSGSGADSDSLRGGVGVEIPLSEVASALAEAAYSRLKFSGAGGGSTNGTEVLIGLKVRF